MPAEQTVVVAGPSVQPTAQDTYTHDVFISYSRGNKQWVREDLLPRLQEVGLKVLIDEDDFLYGKPVMDSIEQAIHDSRHTLAVLTRFWLEGVWTTHERHILGLADPSGRSRRLIPILLEDCGPLPASIACLNFVDCTDVPRRKDALAKLLKELGKSQEVINEAVTHSARKGLRALIDLMQTTPVHDAIGDYKDALQDACRQIDALNRYKGLHDHFHNAESSYDLVAKAKKSLQDETGTWEELEIDALDLEAEVAPLLRFARANFTANEVLWSGRLERAQQDLLASIEPQDLKVLNNATERLVQVLRQVPTQLNNRMFKSAGDLPLSKLVAKLKIVGAGLTNLGLEGEATTRLQDFKLGLDALEKLDRSLQAFVTNHNCLQEIDDQLRLSDPSPLLSPAQVQAAWEDLKGPMNALSGDSGADWVTQFRTISDGLNQALAMIDPAVEDLPAGKKIRSLFFKYRSLVTQGFKQVDQDLKTFCEQLKRVGETLGEELLRLQHA